LVTNDDMGLSDSPIQFIRRGR